LDYWNPRKNIWTILCRKAGISPYVLLENGKFVRENSPQRKLAGNKIGTTPDKAGNLMTLFNGK